MAIFVPADDLVGATCSLYVLVMHAHINHHRLVGTLADLAQAGHDIAMYCQACGCDRLWRYDWLIERLGGDFRVSEWSARYRCPDCGRVGVATLFKAVRGQPRGNGA